MKRKHLFAAVIVVFTAASWLGSCDDKMPPETPAGEISVQTAAAEVSLPEVSLRGLISGNRADVSSAGFMWGLDRNELTRDAEAVIEGDYFSAALTIREEDYNTTFYYRGYVWSKGERIFCPDVKSFSTDYGDKLLGKKWLELPTYDITDGRVAKAYYSTFKGGVQGRNYSILYDPTYVLSLWVAFPLNKDLHFGDQGRFDSWTYDTSGDIPTSVQANMAGGAYKEYPTYQRGHQIAHADRNCTYDAAKQTYMATNSTPQLGSFNGGVWGSLESAIRTVVSNSMSQDTLYVVTGPMMSASPQMAHDKDGKECPIPDKYFKVVLWSKYVSDDERSYDTIGFIMENASEQSGYANYALSVSKVEEQTKFEFFGNLGLSPNEMATLKSTSSWSEFSSR